MARTLTLVRNRDVATRADENVRLVVEMMLASRRLHRDALVPVLGTARSTVYAKLSGKQRFTIGEVALMAEFFELDPGAFLAGPNALLRTAQGRLTPHSVTGPARVSRSDTPQMRPRLRLVA